MERKWEKCGFVGIVHDMSTVTKQTFWGGMSIMVRKKICVMVSMMLLERECGVGVVEVGSVKRGAIGEGINNELIWVVSDLDPKVRGVPIQTDSK